MKLLQSMLVEKLYPSNVYQWITIKMEKIHQVGLHKVYPGLLRSNISIRDLDALIKTSKL